MVMACERDAFLLSRGQMADVAALRSRAPPFSPAAIKAVLHDDEDRSADTGKRKHL